MHSVRNNHGKFKKRFYKRFSFWFLAIGFCIIAAGQHPAVNNYEFISNWFKPELTYIAPKAEAAEVVTEDKIAAMKNDVLDQLKNCENKEGVALIWDTNNAASIGDYMFQIKTVQHYWLKKTGDKLTQKEAARLALDDVKSRELAAWIIFEDKGVDHDWVNCARRHGLQTLVDFIQKYD